MSNLLYAMMVGGSTTAWVGVLGGALEVLSGDVPLNIAAAGVIVSFAAATVAFMRELFK